MNWKDLNIRKKIGSGFLVIIGISILTGAIILFYLYRITRETKELSEVYIPSVNEASKVMRYWHESSEYARSYDFTGNDFFSSKQQVAFDKMSEALIKLSSLMKGREKELLAKGVNLEVLRNFSLAYKNSREAYELTAQEYARLENDFNTLITNINATSSGTSQAAKLNGIAGMFKLHEILRDCVKVFEEMGYLNKNN